MEKFKDMMEIAGTVLIVRLAQKRAAKMSASEFKMLKNRSVANDIRLADVHTPSYQGLLSGPLGSHPEDTVLTR